MNKKYHVALSFAGEQRGYVNKVAYKLEARGVSVFYDEYEQTYLWGKDLPRVSQKVYGGEKSHCVVVFASREYVAKPYPQMELKHALAREIQGDREYILVGQFDDVVLPGVPKTKVYVDLDGKSPEEFAEKIVAKLSELGIRLHETALQAVQFCRANAGAVATAAPVSSCLDAPNDKAAIAMPGDAVPGNRAVRDGRRARISDGATEWLSLNDRKAVVQWRVLQKQTGKRPLITVRFQNWEKTYKDWKDLSLGVVEELLVKTGLLTVQAVRDRPVPVRNSEIRYFVHTKPEHPTGKPFGRSEKLSNGLFMETNHGSQQKQDLIRYLLQRQGVDPAAVQVRLQARRS